MNREETRQMLAGYGFKEIPHFTVMKSMNLDLGRRRFLSIGCVGEPNEMMFIQEIDKDNNKKVTDLICVHNYDYDGYLTQEKLVHLLKGLGKLEKN